MKKFNLILCSVALMLLCGTGVLAHAQGSRRGPDPSVLRDPELEKESMHNLEVARNYFKLKKAYRASLARCEEIIAGNPTFSRMDEVLYIAGESSLFLSQKQGKQAPYLPVEKHREDARDYLSRLVKEFPESSYRKRAENDLQAMGGVKPKQ